MACVASTSMFLSTRTWNPPLNLKSGAGITASDGFIVGSRAPCVGLRVNGLRCQGVSECLCRQEVRRLRLRLLAKRKSEVERRVEDDLDEDMRAGLNEITTEALKVMLAENDKMLEQFREKVDYLGEYLVEEGQLDAARFMLIIRGMLDHELYPQKDELKGPYKKAFHKIAAMIEDSGWVLKLQGQDVGGVELVDDELIPPVLNTRM